VNKVLDKDRPVFPEANISGNAGPSSAIQTCDLAGRKMYVTFMAKF
jgi:hypothetical protein